MKNYFMLICLVFSFQTLFAQEVTVKGIVKDETGPLIGVTVVVEGTQIGTVTDVDGNYMLKVPSNQNTLKFSFIGYKPTTEVIGDRTTINVSLVEDIQGLDEVVVIGYGTAKRSDLTGATSGVSAKEVVKQPAARLDEVLQGRAPGLAIKNTSGAPNGEITIRIRGSNSINGSNDPLVVVDGFVGGNLSTINPNEIESIEVLKDASSTAIYGSRGANGVIMVTTKKGSAQGNPVVEYNGFASFTQISNKLDLLNAEQYAITTNANREALGLGAAFTDAEIADFRANGGTDWQDEIYRSAIQQSHQVSVSGGSSSGSYYLSANYVDNNGIIEGSSYNRVSVRSNLESTINSKLSAGVNIYLAKATNHPAEVRGFQDISPVQAAMLWSPTLPVYNEDGSYTMESSVFGPPSVHNPLALAVEPIKDFINDRAEINSYLNYEIMEGLSFKAIFGVLLSDSENSSYGNTKPAGGLGDATASIYNNRSWVLQNTNQLNYNTTINEDHELSATLAFELQREEFNSNNAGSNGYSSDVMTYNNLAIGTKPQVPSSFRSRKDIISYLGRINYSYKNRYLISVNSRYDGASVFGDDKWGFFPSGAFAWRMNNEEFMSGMDNISNLKLRASYGVTGSQAVRPYASLSTLNTNYPYAIGDGPTTGIGLGTVSNSDLKWEKTGQFNAGVDLGLFGQRITMVADYYDKRTKDLLLNVPLPRVSGYGNVLKNVGSVQNWGVEFNIGGDPIIGDFNWSTNFNISFNRNKVLALAEGEEEITLGGAPLPQFGNTIFLRVGEPIGLLKGYIQEGIWGTDEAEEAASYGAFPGAPKYRDVNDDGAITSADITDMGSTYPKFTYGFTNTFTYKAFDMNIFIQGSQGNKIYNAGRVRSERSSSDADATDVRILNRWTPDNQDTDVPSFLGTNNYEQNQSSRWLEDGSYLRVKNITIGYTLPESICNSINISSLRLYVTGNNLITFTEYTGYDPEASTNVDTMGGIDLVPYPSQKGYTIGLNLRF